MISLSIAILRINTQRLEGILDKMDVSVHSLDSLSSRGTFKSAGKMEASVHSLASLSTQDNRPDGGKRGWLTATACLFVNICLTIILLLVFSSTEQMKSHFGSEHSEEIMKAFKYTGQIGIFIGGILMEIIGYRIAGIIGCGMVALGLFVTSFLDEGGGKAAIFFTGVLTGTGVAFMRLTITVPILECFIKRRIWAILFVLSGEYIVMIIYIAVLVSGKQADFKWNHVFRYQLFPSLIALLICLTLKQYYNKERAAWRDLVFKYHTLYVFITVLFFDQFGKNVIDVNTLAVKLVSRVDDKTLNNLIVVGISVSVGLLLGTIFTVILLRSEKMKKLLYIMFVMATVNILSGSFTLAFYKHMKEVGILTTYGLLYGSTSGIFSSILDNAIPTEFEMHNVRIVEAVLGLSSTMGEIAAGESSESIEEKAQFDLAGSLIFISGILALVFCIWLVVKKKYIETCTISVELYIKTIKGTDKKWSL